jgi:hypothetical protein
LSVYRDNARFGALVSEHRAGTISYWAAAALGAAATLWLLSYLRHAAHPSMRSWIGVVALPAMSIWMIAEGLRLRRIVLHLYERGLSFQDRHAVHEVTWDEITAIRAEHLRSGALANAVLTARTGTFSLPKELRGFKAIVDEVQRRSGAPVTKVEIATLMQRTGR